MGRRMSNQPHHLPQTAERVQRLILRLLLTGEGEPLWPLESVVQQVGDTVVAIDALVALSDAGLVHRWGHYVIPTRAAMHCYWLFG